jgi:hypothetical protein
MKCLWLSRLLIAAFALPLTALAQQGVTQAGCPVTFVHFDNGGFSGFNSGVNLRVKNAAGKKIVGMTFNAALADATEHWQWIYWFPAPVFGQVYAPVSLNNLPLRAFGWNKGIDPGASKSMSWNYLNLNHSHGGAAAMVLTSILFADGSRWDELPDRVSCIAVSYNSRKSGLATQIILPPRPPNESF